jgi:3-hydroxy-9,10-secoandrosta-1,3,5(10)-triene-9,17-dione monooxygenase reductase component
MVKSRLPLINEFSYIQSTMPTPDIPAGPVAGPTPSDLPLPSPQLLRSALGRFATGVSIITCSGPGSLQVGLTANSFSALSLDPPLVLWSLRQASSSLAAFDAAPHFAVNVLAESQVDLSRRFASSAADKFAEGAWSPGVGGAPVLAGCAAVFECEVASRQVAGDHVLFIGRVLRLADLSVAPLLFQGGHYRMLGEIL